MQLCSGKGQSLAPSLSDEQPSTFAAAGARENSAAIINAWYRTVYHNTKRDNLTSAYFGGMWLYKPSPPLPNHVMLFFIRLYTSAPRNAINSTTALH